MLQLLKENDIIIGYLLNDGSTAKSHLCYGVADQRCQMAVCESDIRRVQKTPRYHGGGEETHNKSV